MKLLSLIVLALASLTLTPHPVSLNPTIYTCQAEMNARLKVIQALLDEGVITPQQAAARRKAAYKLYQACVDSIPPGTPD